MAAHAEFAGFQEVLELLTETTANLMSADNSRKLVIINDTDAMEIRIKLDKQSLKQARVELSDVKDSLASVFKDSGLANLLYKDNILSISVPPVEYEDDSPVCDDVGESIKGLGLKYVDDHLNITVHLNHPHGSSERNMYVESLLPVMFANVTSHMELMTANHGIWRGHGSVLLHLFLTEKDEHHLLCDVKLASAVLTKVSIRAVAAELAKMDSTAPESTYSTYREFSTYDAGAYGTGHVEAAAASW